MKKYSSFGLLAAAAIVVASCSKDPQSPGYEYMPDMYRSVGSESYQPSKVFANGANAQTPVDGTVPYQFDRSKILNVLPYPYTDDAAGYAASVAQVNPIPFSEAVLKEGETLYMNNCSHCHGKTGLGDGPIGQKQPALVPPAYNKDLKDRPAGQIFYVITYGRNMMGPHASIISKIDRWKIVHYVQSLQKLPAEGGAAASDSTAAKKPAADSTAKTK